MTTVDYVMSLSVLEASLLPVDDGLTLTVRPVGGGQHVAELRSGDALRASSASHASPIDALADAIARWLEVRWQIEDWEEAHGA